MISNVIYGILGVLTAIFYALFSWQKHKTKKAEKKLEDKEKELATEKVKELETETVKEAGQHEKEIDQKEVENEQAIQETQDDSETLDAINTMLDKFNRRV
jgi:cytochrome c-type biogenesis protein CcmH/NrfG